MNIGLVLFSIFSHCIHDDTTMQYENHNNGGGEKAKGFDADL